jgi:hypothetical protein
MTNHFPPPPLQQFERLHVTDGLLIDAQRWQLAHHYHRQYHSTYYQSLHQPGIVFGLGVHIVPAPADVVAKYRDERWVEIQPGLAIDLFGNFIVVPEAMSYRISSEATPEQPLMVYLVVKFRDPAELRTRRVTDRIIETFRINEKTSPPTEGDVELCRILLKAGPVKLEVPVNIFSPNYNQLDLRYRLQPQARPQAIVHVAMYKGLGIDESEHEHIVSNLAYLLQSTAGLYPGLQGGDKIGQFSLKSAELQAILEYDLFFLTDRQVQVLGESEFEVLRQYLQAGGTVLVEASAGLKHWVQGDAIKNLSKIYQDLEQALTQIDDNPNIDTDTKLKQCRQDIVSEREMIATELARRKNSIAGRFQEFAQSIGIRLTPLEKLDRHDLLRTQPFLFATTPRINRKPIQVLSGGGIIVAIGNLSEAWGINEKRLISREVMRTAQELGINILHLAWRRRQLTRGQQPPPTVTTSSPSRPSNPSQPSDRSRRNELFDKLM